MKLLLASLCLALAACGSKSQPTKAPADLVPAAPAAPTADCADYEHTVDLCRATCSECAETTPGNSCNVCAEGCADKLFCTACNASDHCPE